ncbi:DUF262 domain-containing protein [Burkholderia gladioli]|uniref:DUF262 domain-containing protein n=1 Tax=Burkholderia gladioli TaxID=28095 RepID=UPI0034DB0ABC
MANGQINLIDDDEVVPSDQQEAEDDLYPEKSRISDAVLFNTDWTVETLFRQIDKGNINLDPKFQRREAWDVDRKSKFIESILCNFPIPNVVLAEDKASKGRYVVIDGKQRLFSIFSYLRDEFELRGLAIRNDLNGSRFSDLASTKIDDVGVVENYPIRTVIIRNWPDEDYLYTVFYRLNSGSLPLSPQELRKALHGGILLDYIDEFIRCSPEFKRIFGEKLDPRMRDVELVLRFVAFERFFAEYSGNLKVFLDKTVQFYDGAWAAEKMRLDLDLKGLSRALDISSRVFGKDAFKKWNGTGYERRINRAVFDVITRYFSDDSVMEVAVQCSGDIRNRFNALCEGNESFRESIERTTKTPAAVHVRYKLWGEQLANILGRRLDVQSMRII